MTHYDIPAEFADAAKEHKLRGPCFIGQGCTHSVGSDSYGLYVTFIGKSDTGKTYYGLTHAHSEMRGRWEEGIEVCTMPEDRTPNEYIIKYRNKWWFCDKYGKRFEGKKCRYSWNGAYAYRDPSF